MDVIGFLCVSLGSSTVQLHDSIGTFTIIFHNNKVSVADAHTYVQRLVLVVKMATLLEEYTTEMEHPVVCSLWTKKLNAKDIHKEMFPVYGGKCLSRKAVHSWVANVSRMTKKLKRRCGSG
jgi:hypothetical protein